MSHAYTENRLVEQPAIGLFAELGWTTVSALQETFGANGTLLRETKGEVVLVSRLRAALQRLNPALPTEAITAAVDELTRDRSAMSLKGANREVYLLLKEGIKVSMPDRERGGQKTERLRVVDWENPANNDFPLYTCRADLVGFINGLPLVVIELKKPGVSARAAFDENLRHYKQQIPALFWFNALLIASNGTDSRVGSLTADWERFFEWKRIEREDEPRRVSLEVIIRGTCERARLLDLVENFTLFSEHKAGVVKIIGQNHQFLGVNNAITSMLSARKSAHGRCGVFWQTQGSGKSFSMVFFAQKVLRKVTGDWTFVVVTDRLELDDQIAKTFKATGAVSEAESDQCHATSGAHLRELLRGNHRYVFTLIHKFQTPEMLCERPDVIVLTDEAHRSQYDTLALNMRAVLPKALFLAFTGTPLIAGEERTKEVFGDYVSIYDFQQSVEDGATVPLFYENRTPELQLVNPDLNEDIYNLIEAAELDPEQEVKLERELSKQYHILTRDDRLETVAQDIVRHFLARGFVGKAMVVSIDKATALKMHDKVRKLWQKEHEHVQKELGRFDLAADRKDELLKRLNVLKTTDMALIVSPSQNEIEQMQARGLDIVPHRKRMNAEALDEKFKDTEDPLRLVFLCAMWLTGFDAPSCSTVYLDRPMRNHTLMQTIARANRVFPGKHSGVIVDYANVFASLEKALAIYGAGKGGKTPVRDKKELVEELRKAVNATTRADFLQKFEELIESYNAGSRNIEVSRRTCGGKEGRARIVG
jgi:type I restriction enzyme, R subunit